MRISPLRQTRPKPVALLTPGQREMIVATQWGETLYRGRRNVERALDELAGFTCFISSGVERMKHTTGATSWTMSTWHGRETRIVHDASGTSVTSLRGTLEDSKDPFADLTVALSWLSQFGVNPSGVSSMAWNLFRASLTDDVVIAFDPEISSAAFFGGRQGIEKPGTFYDQRLVDKVAAYPTAMASRPVALTLAKVHKDTVLDPDVSGLASATVTVSDVDYPPLPVRVGPEAIQFQWGVLNGTWTWNELAYAKDLGCDVIVHECYAPARESHLFYNWWTMAQEGRRLPGSAGRLAKAVANSLWGQLAMNGEDRSEIRWTDDKGLDPYETILAPRRLPHEYGRHVAAEVTSRVRVDLGRALYETGAKAAHIDTDGIIIGAKDRLPSNYGDGFGQFRVKEEIWEVEIRAPQLYRWRGFEDPLWHYVASGMNEHQAIRYFTEKGHFATSISYLADPDVVLPDGFSFDWSRNDELLREGMLLR